MEHIEKNLKIKTVELALKNLKKDIINDATYGVGMCYYLSEALKQITKTEFRVSYAVLEEMFNISQFAPDKEIYNYYFPRTKKGYAKRVKCLEIMLKNIKEEKNQSFDDNKAIQRTKKDLKSFLNTTDNEKLKYYVSVLKRKRLYNKYIDACLSYDNCFYFREPKYRNNSLKSIKSWGDFIGGSFLWESTKEKSIFWQNISNIKIRENVI